MNCNFAVDDITSKIKSLRTSYVREFAKVNASKKSGSGMDDVYVSKWKYYYTLDAFLRPEIISRKPTTNLVSSFMPNPTCPCLLKKSQNSSRIARALYDRDDRLPLYTIS